MGSLALVKRTHLAAVALLPVALLSVTGCFNGPNATTTMQATMNTGNGVQAQQGAIRIENATVVKSPEAGEATLLVRLVNDGPQPDALTFATVNGQAAEIIAADATSAVELAPGSSTSFGWESDLRIDVGVLDAEVSTYVPIELGFATAGLASMSVLVVPQSGYYENVTILP